MKTFLVLLITGFLLFPSAASALTVISPVVEISADPSATERGIVKVFNESDKPLELKATVEKYAQFGLGGTDHLQWISLDQSEILLLAKQVVIVPFTVAIPANAEPGGYYATIAWREK